MSAPLAARLRAFVVECLEGLMRTHLPDLDIPRVFAGHEVGTDVRADLAFTIGLLGAGGVAAIGGIPIADALTTVLAPTDGRRTHTFFSYRIAETVGRFGPFADNPVLGPLTDAQRANVAEACDSRSYLPLLDQGLPRNYAAVLARCEAGRAALGLPVDASVLDDLVARTRALLTANPGGYLDDSTQGDGRFDIYSVDIYLFTELIAPLLGDLWRTGAVSAIALAETVVASNGAAITWGRSTGALSLCLTIELAGLAAHHGLVGPPGLEFWMDRAEDAFRSLRPWFPDGLIAAHQFRSTYEYRGPARRLQMTLDCLGKLADAANGLDAPAGGHREAATTAPRQRDTILWFDEARRAGVWSYRSRDLAFVLPMVGASVTDYLPAPRNPGTFEVPVDAALVTGVPVAFHRSVRYAPAGLPAAVTRLGDGVEIRHDGWVPAGHMELPGERFAGSRRALYRVDGRTLRVEEEVRFERPPHALALQVAETAGRPLDVRFDVGPEARVTVVDTSGLKEYRSVWAELPRVHQVDLAPSTHVTFRWSVSPKLRVLSAAYGHHYDRSLYAPLGDRIVEGPVPRRVWAGDWTALDDWDQFHMHWPEWTLPPELARHRELIEGLQGAGVRIVWTQHNLRPHDGDSRWDDIYRAWAGAADAVIHHTQWGMDKARACWDYGPGTVHRIIPHGHFGHLMERLGSVDRRATEDALGLRSGVLRLGIVGAPRPAKQVALAMEAVQASSRGDVELLVLSLRPGEDVPDDARIVGVPYEMVERDEYNRRLATIDVLVLPFEEDGNMLATGTVADAIGAGLPSIISDWPFLTEYLGDAGIPYGRTASDLTRCIDTLDAERIGHARQAASQRRDQYDWARIAEVHLALLDEIGTTKV